MSAHPQPLCGERLLAACEQGRGERDLLRPITLLAAALPGCDRTQLLNLSISQRNRLLLQLRRISFGDVMEGYATCGQCGTSMEFALTVEAALESLGDEASQHSVEWLDDGRLVRLRQTTTADLVEAAREPSYARAAQRLLLRCLGQEDPFDERGSAEHALLQSVQTLFEQLHADCELRCTLRCPQCEHEAAWDLDIGHFVWQEARHAASRLVTDVHSLALHYGWSERSILKMSQKRRASYLELLST